MRTRENQSKARRSLWSAATRRRLPARDMSRASKAAPCGGTPGAWPQAARDVADRLPSRVRADEAGSALSIMLQTLSPVRWGEGISCQTPWPAGMPLCRREEDS